MREGFLGEPAHKYFHGDARPPMILEMASSMAGRLALREHSKSNRRLVDERLFPKFGTLLTRNQAALHRYSIARGWIERHAIYRSWKT